MFQIYDGRKEFFQWDLNQKVIVAEKVDRVHFEIGGKIEATEVKEEDGIFVAAVPNIILQIAGKLLVYAYIMGEGDEESITKVKDCFSINGRAKPPDYVYTETEVLSYETIRKELAEIEKRLKKVEETGGGGTGASGGYYIPNVSEDGVLSWTATEETMPPVPSADITGPEGKPGKNGEPGYTPQKGVDYFDGEPGKQGEPGYTPQKGIDYFDGEPGEPGKTPDIQIGTVETVSSDEQASASVTGSAEKPVLNLKIPQGKQGSQGEPGKGLTILGYYPTLLQLETSVLNPAIGDIYGVGSAAPYNLYSWDGTKWVDNGQLQGAKGEKGDPFTYENFTPEQLEALKGSDANVTSENIKKALGYVPANEEDIPEVPTNVSAFENDADYAKRTELPAKTSDLTNDSGFITAKDIPAAPEVPVKSVNGKTGAVVLSAADVGARPSTWLPTPEEIGAMPESYSPTYEDVGADKEGKAAEEVGRHNTSENAHNDIRVELTELRNALEAFLDIDDPTFDQLSELIQKIEANAGTITELTNGKVNVADIVNNLTTNVANKPLSAAQGVVLKGLVDELDTIAKGAKSTAETAKTTAEEAKSLATTADTNAKNASDKVDNLEERMDSGEFKGEPGTPGADGVSIVSVEQTTTSSADGGENVVTVTLSNGTKSIFIFKNGSKGSTGEKGNGIKSAVLNADYTLTFTFDDGTELTTPSIRGAQGPKGDTYELTEADKEEIAEMVGGSKLPDYYTDYLAEKIASIKALQEEAGANASAFVVWTDSHDTASQPYAAPLAKKVMEECYINKVFYLGDAGGYSLADETATKNSLDRCMAKFKAVIEKLILSEGNHDRAHGANDEYFIDKNVFYAHYHIVNGGKADNYGEENDYCYVDDKAERTRYIIVNTWDYPNIEERTEDVFMGLRQAQYDWLKEALNVNDGWSVIVLTHIPPIPVYFNEDNGNGALIEARTPLKLLAPFLAAYEDKTTYTETFAGLNGEATGDYLNLFDVNGEGFSDNSRFGTTTANDSSFITNWIPCSTGDIVHLRYDSKVNPYKYEFKVNGTADANYRYFANASDQAASSYDSSVKVMTAGKYGANGVNTQEGVTAIRFEIREVNGTAINPEDANLIITVNQNIQGTAIDPDSSGGGWDALNISADFTDYKGDFVSLISGHTHQDQIYLRKDGYAKCNVMTVCCDARGLDSRSYNDIEAYPEFGGRAIGTVYEQCLDVVVVDKKNKTVKTIRIGAGYDRNFSY